MVDNKSEIEEKKQNDSDAKEQKHEKDEPMAGQEEEENVIKTPSNKKWHVPNLGQGSDIDDQEDLLKRQNELNESIQKQQQHVSRSPSSNHEDKAEFDPQPQQQAPDLAQAP